MKGKKVIAGILLVGILATALAGCKNTNITKKEREKPCLLYTSDFLLKNFNIQEFFFLFDIKAKISCGFVN